MGEQATTGVVQRIYGNMARLMSGKAAAALIGLAYMAIAARTLGPRDYGVLVLVHGFSMAIGGIVEFPGWHAIVRYGAEAKVARDMERLVRLLRFAGLIELIGGALAVIVAAVLGPLLGARLGWSPDAIAFAVPYSLAVLASIRAAPAGFLQLAGRFDLLGFHNVVPPAVRLAGSLIVVVLGGGLRGFLIAWLAAALCEWAAMWGMGLWVARRWLPEHRIFGSVASVTSENRGIWRFMLAANADLTLSDLSSRVTPLVVGWVMGPAPAGLFAIAQRATVIIQQPGQILGRAAYAELAKLVANGGTGVTLRRTVVSCILTALGAALPVVVVLALFGRQVAVLLGGPAFVGAAGLMTELVSARAVLLVVPPAAAALTALGRPGLSALANMATSVGLLPLLPLLLMRFGLTGAGWHAVLQAGVTAILLSWMVRSQSVDRTHHPASVEA